MTKTEIIIIAILAAWLIACIFYALFNNQMAKYTNRWDIFRLISAYQLFSGEQRRYFLFYRDWLSDTQEDEWKQAPLVPVYRWYHSFWFPEELPVQIITSTVDDLVTVVKAGKSTQFLDDISERFIYQTILRFVNRFPASITAKKRQFKIEESSGFVDGQQPLFVFISPFHQL